MSAGNAISEVFPLIWSTNVAALTDWSVQALDLRESWRAEGEGGQVEHAELHGFNGKISINIDRGDTMGPSGISLRVDDKDEVDRVSKDVLIRIGCCSTMGKANLA